MLFVLCKKCGKLLPDTTILYEVLVDEGSGIVTPMKVCESCYETINNDSELILG